MLIEVIKNPVDDSRTNNTPFVTDETVVDRIYELSDELVRFTTGLNSS